MADTEDITMSIGLDITQATKSATALKNVYNNLFDSVQKKATSQLANIGRIQDKLTKLYDRKQAGDVSFGLDKEIESLENQFNIAVNNMGKMLASMEPPQRTVFQPIIDQMRDWDLVTEDVAKNLSKVNNLTMIFGSDISGSQEATNFMNAFASAEDEATRNARLLQEEEERLKEKQQAVEKSLSNCTRVLTAFRTGLTKLEGIMSRAVRSMARFAKSAIRVAKTNLAKLFKDTNKEIGKTNKGLSNATSTLKKFILAGLGVRSIYFLFRKFWAMIKEGVNIVAQVDKDVNKALSSIMTVGYTLKKQLGAMVSQLVTAVAPILEYLIGLLVKLATVATQVIAALTGKGTYKKATKQWQDYAKSLDKSAKSAKKLQDNLSGLDEINKWKEPTEDGGIDLGGAFEDIPVEDWAKDVSDKIKNIFSKLFAPLKEAWDNVGKGVMDAWRGALDSVWGLIKTIGSDFLTVWNQPETVRIFENILTIIKDIGLFIDILATKFKEAWTTNDVGLHILEHIRDLILIITDHFRSAADATVDWAKTLDFYPLLEAFDNWLVSAQPLIDALMGILEDFYTRVLLPLAKWTLEKGLPELFDIFTRFNNAVDWDKIRTNLQGVWDSLEKFGERVGEGLLKFIDDMSQKLADFLNSEEFEEWLESVQEWLDSISQDDINDFFESLEKVLHGVWTVLKTIAKIVWDNKDVIYDLFKKFANFMGSLTTEKVEGIIQNIAVAFITLKAAIFGVNTVLAGLKFASFLKPISEALATIVTKFSGAGALIAGIFTAALNFFAMLKNGFNWLNEILMVVGIALAAVGAVILGIPAAIAAAVAAAVAIVATLVVVIKDHWEDIKRVTSELWEKIKTGFSEFWESLKEKVSSLGGKLKETWEKMWSSVKETATKIWTDITSKISEKFNNIKTNISNILTNIKSTWTTMWTNMKTTVTTIFTNMWNSIKGVINSIIGGVEKMANGVIKGLNGMIGAINKLEFTLPDWVPLVGGKSLGFEIPTIKEISIPRLAQGGVIPANSPFLAMLGDQKQGTNIEAPLETIKQAVAEVIGSNSGGNNVYQFIAQLNRRTLFDEVITEARLRQSASGNNPFETLA